MVSVAMMPITAAISSTLAIAKSTEGQGLNAVTSMAIDTMIAPESRATMNTRIQRCLMSWNSSMIGFVMALRAPLFVDYVIVRIYCVW